MQTFSRQFSAPTIRRILTDGSTRQHPFRHLHASTGHQFPRKREHFFSSKAPLQQEGVSVNAEVSKDAPTPQKRKPMRAPAGKTSLRRVAVEAQRSRETALRKKDTVQDGEGSNRVTAISVASQFDMEEVIKILRSHGFSIDPDGTQFDSDQVIHTRGVNNGDIFVFPSGTLVAWSLPEDVVSDLATKILLPAAIEPHIKQIETEDLEYTEDEKRESSTIKGDVIALGTKPGSQAGEKSKYVVWFPIIECSLIEYPVHDLTRHSQRLLSPLALLDQRNSQSSRRCLENTSNPQERSRLSYLEAHDSHSVEGSCCKRPGSCWS